TDKLLTRFTILICDIEHQYVPVLFNKFDWFPNIHTTPMELEKYLLAHNMIWTILPSPWNQEEDWQLIYKVGEAIIAFDNNGLCYIAT
ncbi:MAG: hypothetical protein LBL62_10980, partial [Planctomycetaceae bacterium]|nr:hypothetical protein [Planctomycetaceae bacterium]